MIIEIEQKVDGKEEDKNFKVRYKLTTDVIDDDWLSADDIERKIVDFVEWGTLNGSPTENSKMGIFYHSEELYGMEFSTVVNHYFQRESISSHQ